MPGRESTGSCRGRTRRPGVHPASSHRAARAPGSARMSSVGCTVLGMTRTRVRHQCEACGVEQPKWLGRCPDCGEWGSVVEQPGPARRPRHGVDPARPASVPVPLADVDPLGAPLRAHRRRPSSTGCSAAAWWPDRSRLLAGEPGIGKSTLLLQALVDAWRARGCALPARLRRGVGRAGAAAAPIGSASPPPEPADRRGDVAARRARVRRDARARRRRGRLDPDRARPRRARARPDRSRRSATARSGSCGTRRSRASRRCSSATSRRTARSPGRACSSTSSTPCCRSRATAITGVRTLRALKHRFGPTDELGRLRDDGRGARRRARRQLAAAHGAARRARPARWSRPRIEGARPLLVEVQALVTRTPRADRRDGRAGARQRPAVAARSRCCSERAGVDLAGYDVYANVAGGVRVAEPGVDLAVAMAVAERAHRPAGPGRHRRRSVRWVSAASCARFRRSARRLAEAARLGFTHAIVPASTPDIAGHPAAARRRSERGVRSARRAP